MITPDQRDAAAAEEEALKWQKPKASVHSHPASPNDIEHIQPPAPTGSYDCDPVAPPFFDLPAAMETALKVIDNIPALSPIPAPSDIPVFPMLPVEEAPETLTIDFETFRWGEPVERFPIFVSCPTGRAERLASELRYFDFPKPSMPLVIPDVVDGYTVNHHTRYETNRRTNWKDIDFSEIELRLLAQMENDRREHKERTFLEMYSGVWKDEPHDEERYEHFGVAYYRAGRLHRLDGPARTFADGSRHWYTNGRLIDAYYPKFGCKAGEIRSRADALAVLHRKKRPYSFDLYMADIDRLFPAGDDNG